MPLCRIIDCDGQAVAKGLCAKHYMRVRKHGRYDVTEKRGPKRQEGSVGMAAEEELIAARKEIERLQLLLKQMERT